MEYVLANKKEHYKLTKQHLRSPKITLEHTKTIELFEKFLFIMQHLNS